MVWQTENSKRSGAKCGLPAVRAQTMPGRRELHLFAALGGLDFHRIRQQPPMSQPVQLFELPRSNLSSTRRVFRLVDVNLMLEALELVPVGAEQIFEETYAILRHPSSPPHGLNDN
jgi:hypothetical protein